jgi:hypothetical protein
VRTRLTCGVILHRRRSPLVRGRWSWPFGCVHLSTDELVAYSRLFGKRWAVRLPYAEIDYALVKPVRLGGKVRLARRSESEGDVTVVTLGDGYRVFADLLRVQGVAVRTDG